MIWLLQMVLFGHSHKWKIIKSGRYRDYNSGSVGEGGISAQGVYHTQECEKCGKLKVFKE